MIGVLSPGGRGIGGESGGCPGTDRPEPDWRGALRPGADCFECCPVPQPEALPGTGSPCLDLGHLGAGMAACLPLPPDPPDFSGSSPIVVNYTVDLSGLPPNPKLATVVTLHQVTVPAATWTLADDGAAVETQSSIPWPRARWWRVANAAGNPAFPVRVELSWAGGGTGTLRINNMLVCFYPFG